MNCYISYSLKLFSHTLPNCYLDGVNKYDSLTLFLIFKSIKYFSKSMILAVGSFCRWLILDWIISLQFRVCYKFSLKAVIEFYQRYFFTLIIIWFFFFILLMLWIILIEFKSNTKCVFLEEVQEFSSRVVSFFLCIIGFC